MSAKYDYQKIVDEAAAKLEGLLHANATMLKNARKNFNDEAMQYFENLSDEIAAEATSRLSVEVSEKVGLKKQSNRAAAPIITNEE